MYLLRWMIIYVMLREYFISMEISQYFSFKYHIINIFITYLLNDYIDNEKIQRVYHELVYLTLPRRITINVIYSIERVHYDIRIKYFEKTVKYLFT